MPDPDDQYDDRTDDDRPRRRPRRRDDDRDDDDRRDRPRPGGGSNTLAVVGLVLGVVSLCGGCLAGVPAIVVSVIAMRNPVGKGMATAGVVLGAIGMVFGTAVMIGLLLPAVQKVREAAGRSKDQNNLKQIMLGVHGHSDANGALPPADGDLSWRVHMLPFVEANNVYARFDLKQPWDGAKNRPLADVRVPAYASLADPPETTQTHYRVFVGPGTLYEPGEEPPALAAIPDGTSNTIFAVEAEESVPWPQPKELPFTPNGPLPALGHARRDVVLVAMLDGSIRAVKKNKVTPAVLRGLVTPTGEERLPEDW